RFAAGGEFFSLVHFWCPTCWGHQATGGIGVALGHHVWRALRRRRRHQNVLPALSSNCLTIGPSASAGKYVRAPTMSTVPIRRPDQSAPYVGNVPRLTGTRCLRTIEPAIASKGTIIRKRPISIARPMLVFQYVFAPSPAKAEPLLPVAEV